MNLKNLLKRTLCMIIISATLLLASSCDEAYGSESDSDSDSMVGSEITVGESDADEKITLSENQSIRVVYSSAYKTLAQKVSNKLISLDKTYVKGSDKYAIAQDTSLSPDGAFEILIGNTNRDATAEAKKLVSGKKNSYSIYVTDGAIAVYASNKAGVEEAVTALLKKISKKNDAVMYDNSKGNIVGKYTLEEKETDKVQKAPIMEVRTPTKTDVDVDNILNTLKNAAGSKAYSIAVSSTDGIKVASIRNTNPQNTYSVSKVFCVTAIGMLYDEGKLKTSDTIGEIFKAEIKAYGIDENKWKNVTVHDVLRHRAGFTQGGLLDIDQDPSLMDKHDDFLKVVLKYNISLYDKRDGDGNIASRKYTDAAYYLISRVVSKVSGQTLDVYLKSRLFDKADYQNYRIVKCPQGHPIGATQFFLRPDDVVKLGRIYLDGGKYNGKRIISQDWVNQVIKNGYELQASNNGYAKGGMCGQYLYVNFEHNVAIAWLSQNDASVDSLYGKLKTLLPKKEN